MTYYIYCEVIMDDKVLADKLKRKIDFMLHDIENQHPEASKYKSRSQRPTMQTKRILYPNNKSGSHPYVPE